MKQPETLLEMAGVNPAIELDKSVLVLIDYQNEYLDGALPLFEVERAVENTRKLLDVARENGVPVIHVVHKGKEGGIFDLGAHNGAIISALTPVAGEVIVEKSFPNSFAGTTLDKAIKGFAGRDHLIVAGLMTHMCLASTVSSAIDHGYFTTVIASTTTTRDLKGAQGAVVPAATMRAAALAMIKDRFAIVLDDVDGIFS